MKKSILTFCTVLLLATQAPVANAQEVSDKSNVSDIQSVLNNRYNMKLSYKLIQLPKMFELKKETITKTVDNESKQEKNNDSKPQTVQETANETAPAKTEAKQDASKASVTKPVQQTTSESAQQPAAEQQNTSTAIDVIEQQVVELTNQERAKYGLAALAIDKPLMAAAREKSQDMKDNNYFSHTSPTFGSPFDRMKALGISYKSAGENIAKGQTTAAQVVEAWMNSEGHRANILRTEFTHIGVGYVKDGHIWTQQFIKR